MAKYLIANLHVDMNLYYDRLKNQAKKYIVDDNIKADININFPESFYIKKQHENPHLSLDDVEYIFAGGYFYNKIIDFDGFLLHSSAIAKDGNAYLFSAASGTGKSTHTQNWIKYFGKENITYINDDKPALRLIDDKFYAFGTPFSGKTDLSTNIKVPLKAIIFIKRGKENSCKIMDKREAIGKIFEQTVQPTDIKLMDKFLSLLDVLLSKITIYELTCNMDKESAKICYDFINNN